MIGVKRISPELRQEIRKKKSWVLPRLLNVNGTSANRRWDAYIAAMRGIMTSVAPDKHKINAHIARQRAEERFYNDRNEGRRRRRALWIDQMVVRRR